MMIVVAMVLGWLCGVDGDGYDDGGGDGIQLMLGFILPTRRRWLVGSVLKF
eukprot:m.215477 g.215477  ORF g.215477 m.215477 type:complete len:51 (+) comp33187_c2_seq2:48-200(+)